MVLIGTSYVERQNLTMRMAMKRYTRKTNAFSKSLKHHAAMMAIYMMFYNFVRPHMTTKMTPVVAAGVADQRWTLEDVAELNPRPKPGPREPYKKRSLTRAA